MGGWVIYLSIYSFIHPPTYPLYLFRCTSLKEKKQTEEDKRQNP